MDDGLRINSETDQRGRTTVALRGEVDLSTAGRFERALGEYDSDLDLTIDCVDLGFIDSSGLSVLLRANARLREGGGHLTIHRLSPACRRTFEFAGLDQVLDITSAARPSERR